MSISGDASSDILSHSIPVQKYVLSMGRAEERPERVTLVILETVSCSDSEGLHTILYYRTHVEKKSLYNTRIPGAFISGSVQSVEKISWALGMQLENEERQISFTTLSTHRLYRGHAIRIRVPPERHYRLPSRNLRRSLLLRPRQGPMFKSTRSVVRRARSTRLPARRVEALVCL